MQPSNNVYEFLSGVKVTSETKFIALDNPSELRKGLAKTIREKIMISESEDQPEIL